MEFTIDLQRVRALIREERQALSRASLQAGDLFASHQATLARHDARLAAADDAASLACRAGCHWCCHFSVDVRPLEALHIARHVQQQFSAEELQALQQVLTANAAVLATLDDEQRMHHNAPCPFLHGGQCRIYAVRPHTCRNYHATDATGCEQSWREPDNDDIAPDYAPLVYQIGSAQVETYQQVLSAQGYDVAVYELNAAVLEALQDSQAVAERLFAHQPALRQSEGFDVPGEWQDLLDEPSVT